MHRLGVVADDDDNNKTQAGQFSEIGKFSYVYMADDSCTLHTYIGREGKASKMEVTHVCDMGQRHVAIAS